MSTEKPIITVACAVIHDPEKDSFLMGQRAAHKHHGGLWEFMGGKKDPEDESIQVAMEREIKEEIDVEGEAGEVVMRIDHNYLNGPHAELYFVRFKLPKDAKINPDPDVYQDVDWIQRQKLLDLDMSEGDRLFAETLVNPKS